MLEPVETLVRDHCISLSAQTMINSDQGVHYTCCRLSQIVRDSGLRHSMSRRANCWDNAPQESFFGHMKDDINLASCLRFEQVVTVIGDWMDYDNTDRYQWQLAKLSPNEFYLYATTGEYPLPIFQLHEQTFHLCDVEIPKPATDVDLDLFYDVADASS